MDAATIRRLFAYTDWANARIAQAIEAIADEQFTRSLGGSFGSIADTLAHVLGADWIWLRRWRGESPTAAPEWTHSRDRTVLFDAMRIVRSDRTAWLTQLTDDKLSTILHSKRLSGETLSMSLDDALLHVANHATYHRGQIATMLRQVGAVAPATDFSLYVVENMT